MHEATSTNFVLATRGIMQTISQAITRAVARLGNAMAKYRIFIAVLQWVVVAIYLALLIIPALLPLPGQSARLFDSQSDIGTRLVLLAQYLFWGVWWPFVIFSIVIAGRFWCGVLCPEGTLAEFAARHGRHRAVPTWVRWGGWPILAFVITTLYGQLISVYDYASAALLILGGSTVGALFVGWMYGKGKRAWCRYLCPVSGVFALLTRIAPIAFRTDVEAWESFRSAPNPAHRKTIAIDCPPLLDVKHLQGAAACHACGRCAGHRDAVTLSLRSPATDILHGPAAQKNEALLLIFGMIALAMGAFQWSLNPWFVQLKTTAAEWLIERNQLWALEDNAPWWLLTHYPSVNDSFTWLDGFLIASYILLFAVFFGGSIWLCVWQAARCIKKDWPTLALGLIPLAASGLFLGLSMMTVRHLRSEGFELLWIQQARGLILSLGMIGSLTLGAKIICAAPNNTLIRILPACALWVFATSIIVAMWYQLLFVWLH